MLFTRTIRIYINTQTLQAYIIFDKVRAGLFYRPTIFAVLTLHITVSDFFLLCYVTLYYFLYHLVCDIVRVCIDFFVPQTQYRGFALDHNSVPRPLAPPLLHNS